MRIFYRCVCLVLGALLGAGCDSGTDPDPNNVAEYGMPYGKLRIDGHVRDETGQPIAGVRVSHGGYYGTADTTDASGAWAIADDFAAVPCTPGDSTRCAVLAEDIDGAENGAFEQKVRLLDLTRTEDGEGWYQGRYEQHGIDIVMPESEPEKDEPRP